MRVDANLGSGISNVRHLHQVRSCRATHPRDKILSLLHFLSKKLQSCLISLDNGIELSTEEFYLAIAKFELVDCHDMNVLGAAGLVQKIIRA